MARQDQIGVVSQFADALETVVHPRQIVAGMARSFQSCGNNAMHPKPPQPARAGSVP